MEPDANGQTNSMQSAYLQFDKISKLLKDHDRVLSDFLKNIDNFMSNYESMVMGLKHILEMNCIANP